MVSVAAARVRTRYSCYEIVEHFSITSLAFNATGVTTLAHFYSQIWDRVCLEIILAIYYYLSASACLFFLSLRQSKSWKSFDLRRHLERFRLGWLFFFLRFLERSFSDDNYRIWEMASSILGIWNQR